ncbi:hypothetical protein QBC46DRAFT_391541 [Diplogelasinospora grovesii]|uniref:Uncharacterized protein n=1 Tax=Diplogelasinospora grovesii TaxID=303347 RepID=A0AAN6N3G2_9PEZI|nr:hypothetical protein QBC46DRAFT_391541 [Diplogelasinospora grovesii]
MATKVLIFTGAPHYSSLDWNPKNLLREYIPEIAQFAGLWLAYPGRPDDPPIVSSSFISSNPPHDHAAWRSLNLLSRPHLTTGLSQQHVFNDHYIPARDGQPVIFVPSGPSFTTSFSQSQSQPDITTTSSSSSSQLDEEDSQLMYEHSLVMHDDLPFSQMMPTDPRTTNDLGRRMSVGDDDVSSSFASSSSNGSLLPNETGSSSTWRKGDTTTSPDDDDGISVKKYPHPEEEEEEALGLRTITTTTTWTDLEHIPNPKYLLDIQPQTMTCNVLVGIISISQPKMVKTRWGTSRELVEVLVGDDTRSGFTITFWLSPEGENNMGQLRGLRARDVIGIRNAALNTFKNRVYGSSLRKDLTKVRLLYRQKLDKDDVGGCYNSAEDATKFRRVGGSSSSSSIGPELKRVKRVWEWVLKFVPQGGGGGGNSNNDKRGRAEDNTTGGGGDERRTRARRQWDQPPPLDTQ